MADTNILKGHLAAGCAYTIFGLNIVFCKDIAACGIISPIALFTMRAIGAALLFWMISLFGPKEKVSRKDLPKIAAASFIGLFVPQLTFLSACKMATAIDIAILGTLSPIYTMFVAAIVLKEPVTAKKAGGVVTSFAGVVFLIYNSVVSNNGVDVTSPWGIVLLILNAFSFASYLGIFRPLIMKYSVITFMKWMFLFSLAISLPFSFKDLISAQYSAIPGNVILEIGFLIFFATFVAYFLIPIGQKHIRPTLVSMYSYLQPIIAAAIAIAIGMDRLSWQKILATILVVTGVVIVNRSRAAAIPSE